MKWLMSMTFYTATTIANLSGIIVGIIIGTEMLAPKPLTPNQIHQQCQQDEKQAIEGYKEMEWAQKAQKAQEKDCNKMLAEYTVCRSDRDNCNKSYDSMAEKRHECEYIIGRCERSPRDCQGLIRGHEDR